MIENEKRKANNKKIIQRWKIEERNTRKKSSSYEHFYAKKNRTIFIIGTKIEFRRGDEKGKDFPIPSFFVLEIDLKNMDF